MKGKHVSLWSAALVLLLVLGGCNGTGTENVALKTRVRELETALQTDADARERAAAGVRARLLGTQDL